MIVFPAIAATLGFVCALVMSLAARRQARPERVIWTLAFLVFGVAAFSEVLGSALGWSSTLARIYYLGGAVAVVGILALGELYLLLPARMPEATPGIALLILAVAATAVWSAPIDVNRLAVDGWGAIERGPFLIALAATINAGGTLILAGGTIYSAWALRGGGGTRRRALGCMLIALGTVVVALGGTLTRFGSREYLYLAMALGIAVIFTGVLLTTQRSLLANAGQQVSLEGRGGRLVALPSTRAFRSDPNTDANDGIRLVQGMLTLPEDDLRERCHQWSATPLEGDILSRSQALQVWHLRSLLPEDARPQFDELRLSTQAQLAELNAEIWSIGERNVSNHKRA